MNKIKTIIRKEWNEVFKNKMVLFTVVFLPLFMTILPLAILFFTRGTAGDAVSSEVPEAFAAFCQAGLTGSECFQVYIVSQFMMMFMILPVAIPVTIAAYSIVGEKTTHSLEPLLATPISTFELLAGKALSAAIPAVVATYGGFILYLLGARIISPSWRVFLAMLDARWLIAVFIIGPLLAVASIMFALMVSSRVNDPRVAEQVSMVLIVPVLVGFFGQVSGLFMINGLVAGIIAIVMVVVDAVLIYFSVKVFQREVILTRWK